MFFRACSNRALFSGNRKVEQRRIIVTPMLQLTTILLLWCCAEPPVRFDAAAPAGDGGLDLAVPDPSEELPIEGRFELPSAREFAPLGGAIFTSACESGEGVSERLVLTQWPLSCSGPIEPVVEERSWRALIVELEASCGQAEAAGWLLEHSYQEIESGEGRSETKELERHLAVLEEDELEEGSRRLRVSFQPEIGGREFELGFVEATLRTCPGRAQAEDRSWWLGERPNESP